MRCGSKRVSKARSKDDWVKSKHSRRRDSPFSGISWDLVRIAGACETGINRRLFHWLLEEFIHVFPDQHIRVYQNDFLILGQRESFQFRPSLWEPSFRHRLLWESEGEDENKSTRIEQLRKCKKLAILEKRKLRQCKNYHSPCSPFRYLSSRRLRSYNPSPRSTACLFETTSR